MPTKVIVTGPSGFIGSHLLRTPSDPKGQDGEAIQWIPKSTRQGLGVEAGAADAIVHCAGLAHQMKATDPAKYFEVNHLQTVELARNAKNAGLRQFVFLSSSKVFGDGKGNQALIEDSPCHPTDAYGKSKLLAEHDLLSLESCDFKVAIVRPPLVFGPGVKGNMLRLMKLLDSKWPMPFEVAHSKRSMVNVANLKALIERIVERQASGIFHAGEMTCPTVRDLVVEIRTHLGRSENLFPMPRILLATLGTVAPGIVSRLFDGMELANDQTKQQLGYSPPFSFSQGIQEMVSWFQNEKS